MRVSQLVHSSAGGSVRINSWWLHFGQRSTASRVCSGAGGALPETPTKLQVRRDGNDPRNAFIAWKGDDPGVVGYNILWGIRDDKLYQTYQVWADQRPALELRALTLAQGYSFAIEAFNESGVSKPSAVVRVP